MGKRVFWQPIRNRGKWDQRYAAEFRSRDADNSIWFYRIFDSGMAREEFIREQNQMVRKFSTDEEYAQFYRTVSTLTA
jgi:hypothetical protein